MDPQPAEVAVGPVAELGAQLERIVALGNRFAGTAGEARAREYLVDEFEARGLRETRLEPFPFLAYRPLAARCELLPGSTPIPCVGLQCTADGLVEGDAVYVGTGSEDEIAELERRDVDLRGRIVLATASFPWFVAPVVAARGAAALVNISEAPDGLIGHFTAALYPHPDRPPWEGRIVPIPGVTIEAQAARRLLSLMSGARVRLRVEHRATNADAQSANVIGELEGTTLADERVVIGAHYDTQLEGPGAADNATGLAALLWLVDALRAVRPARTIVFAAFGVEELGLWGSFSYVRNHAAELDRTVGMVNLDALGLPSPGTRLVVADNAIAAFAAGSAERCGWQPERMLDGSLNAWSDHNPFIDAGVPAVWYWRYPPQHPYYHAAGDTLRFVELTRVEDVARASGYLVARLACVPELPFGRAMRTRIHADVFAGT